MIRLLHGDCIEEMNKIDDHSVDFILCDLPYGQTNNEWDFVIDPVALWEQYNRIRKPNTAIVLFGQDKFTAKMMLEQPKLHKYNLIWEKDRPSGFLNANKMPLRSHEDIMVFYEYQPVYNPQYSVGNPVHTKGKRALVTEQTNNNYGEYKTVETPQTDEKHPRSVLYFKRPHPPVHPTQKPLDLIEWLVKTYSIEGDIVLDNCMGSGTTGIACNKLNRSFIGIEKDDVYFDMAKRRIEQPVTVGLGL